MLAGCPETPAIDFGGKLVTWGEVHAITSALESLIEEAGLPRRTIEHCNDMLHPKPDVRVLIECTVAG